jgi:hypothetical protein
MGKRIIQLEAPSATQNSINDMKEDLFMAADGKEKAKSWWAGIFGTKDERIARRTERRANRAERKRLRLQRKSTKQLQIENAAKERALALGQSEAQANAAALEAGAKQKAAEEAAILAAEEKAKRDALAKGLPQDQVDNLTNQAGLQKENEIFGGGYGTEGKSENPKFWGSMSTGAKVALIGGGVVVLGLITWGIVASRKNK